MTNETEAQRLRREAAELFAHADALEQETAELFPNVVDLCMSDTDAGKRYREKVGDLLERQIMDGYRNGQRVFRLGPRTVRPDADEPAIASVLWADVCCCDTDLRGAIVCAIRAARAYAERYRCERSRAYADALEALQLPQVR